MVRSSTLKIGVASAPARNSSARSCPSNGVTPVIWKLVEKMPRMVATLITVSSRVLRMICSPIPLNEFRLLLHVQHGHRPVEVGLGGLEHPRAALAVEPHVDRGLALGIDEGGVGELVPGDDQVAAQERRRAIALVAQDRTQRRSSGPIRGEGVVLPVHEAEFDRGGGAEDALGLGGVLHAGQLHDDAVQALALHHRLGHAQLIDPVARSR